MADATYISERPIHKDLPTHLTDILALCREVQAAVEKRDSTPYSTHLTALLTALAEKCQAYATV